MKNHSSRNQTLIKSTPFSNTVVKPYSLRVSNTPPTVVNQSRFRVSHNQNRCIPTSTKGILNLTADVSTTQPTGYPSTHPVVLTPSLRVLIIPLSRIQPHIKGNSPPITEVPFLSLIVLPPNLGVPHYRSSVYHPPFQS